MLRRYGFIRCIVPQADMGPIVSDTTSNLAKQIWKAAIRGTRVGSIWTQFSKQVAAHSVYLTPRDVSMIIHSFARIKFKDEKLIMQIVPIVIKHMNEFSVRELVSILSSFRKLEISPEKVSCLHLILSQLQLRKSEWTPIDVALIANATSWFKVSDNDLWRSIERRGMTLMDQMSPLGLSLLVGALARLDIRNERLLKLLASEFMKGDLIEPMNQESLAVLINGFAKLDWNPRGLFEVLEEELDQIVDKEGVFFDAQSACIVLHAIIALRNEYLENTITEKQNRIVNKLVNQLYDSMKSEAWKPNIDQLEKLSAVHTILKHQFKNACNFMVSTQKKLQQILRHPRPEQHIKRTKLPRWEYEVFRIMKTKMLADVRKQYRHNRVDVVLRSDAKNIPEIIINCVGPFQYYADSTKRTAVSRLNQKLLELTKKVKFIEIPYYIWNELKTDQDKIMYLMSKGRQVLDGDTQQEELG